MYRWGTKKGHCQRNIMEDVEIKREKMAQRKRRLAPDIIDEKGRITRPGEERRLLEHASPTLQRLIVGALETGCRLGELLNLTWADVNLPARTMTVRAEHAKDREERRLPISDRLAGVLEMARLDPLGEEYKARDFVFGELGRKIRSPKRAWETAVLKAHGHKPVWLKNTLAPESRRQLRALDLRFHDLRHEAGSRMIEGGWPVHHVKEMLGHANLEQTSTYLNVTLGGLHESMRKYGASDARCKRVANAPGIEQPPLCNDTTEAAAQALLN